MPTGAKAAIAFWLGAAAWSTATRKNGQTLSEGTAWLLNHRVWQVPTATVIGLTLVHLIDMTRRYQDEVPRRRT